MISEQQLPHLIKLLDDKDPVTQDALKHEFAETSGDLSNELTALGTDLCQRERHKLSKLLLPARRKTLTEEWLMPDGGAAALSDDWDSFESLLRTLSDFLHDGITLRPALPDMVDLIAEEASTEMPSISANQLRIWMFESGKFIGNRENYYLPQNSDLCWVADTGFGNPISLATLFILVAHRLDLEVTGCNYPGHFLARIYLDGEPQLVDCFHKGRLISSSDILRDHKEISFAAKMAINIDAPLGHILWRFLRNLEFAFKKSNCPEDEKLFASLAQSLH